MKTKLKKPIRRDPMVRQLISTLKKQGVRCGYGDQMNELRKSK
jgi:hypothetical protein